MAAFRIKLNFKITLAEISKTIYNSLNNGEYYDRKRTTGIQGISQNIKIQFVRVARRYGTHGVLS